MNKFKGLFMSERLDWRTPQEFFNKLDQEFDFKLDPCADPKHTLKPTITNIHGNAGLTLSWHGPAFMNPPYGREIGKWLKKAYEESLNGVTIVCLIPSRTDTKWWHEYVMKATEIRFIRGRLKFEGQKNSAPFPSAVVVFDGKKQDKGESK